MVLCLNGSDRVAEDREEEEKTQGGGRQAAGLSTGDALVWCVRCSVIILLNKMHTKIVFR